MSSLGRIYSLPHTHILTIQLKWDALLKLTIVNTQQLTLVKLKRNNGCATLPASKKSKSRENRGGLPKKFSTKISEYTVSFKFIVILGLMIVLDS